MSTTVLAIGLPIVVFESSTALDSPTLPGKQPTPPG